MKLISIVPSIVQKRVEAKRMQREDTEGREHTEARLPPPLLRMATSPIPPSALYSSMAAAMTATMITIAPTTNQFLPIFRARVAR